ncbi:1-acyl-sn-glycerol-3-phosphate acyltransferase [bacterium]|nr:1-acyl-sn-glycerol-3-phosphate acyltransferase [bacterium]
MIGRFARFAARTFFREIVLEGTRHLPSEGPVLFTPNHPNGLLDPMLLCFLSPPFRLRFVAKAPLFKIPVFGSLLRSIGAIPVVRKFEAGGDVDYSVFFAACLDALAKRDSVVIFPEGRSLPQSYMAPLKTGPARLFLMAKERGIHVQIIPVGLNYEKGTAFRSRVLVCIAPPLDTSVFESLEPSRAVVPLTEALEGSLHDHVVQTETYRDRELMQLLERISSSEIGGDSDFERFTRLKEFERGLSRLRSAAAEEIDALRVLLSRYDRLARNYGIERDLSASSPTISEIVRAIAGGVLAIPGWIFNFVPYHLCDLLIRATRQDASNAATFKVIYSLFLFPLCYFFEGYLIAGLAGSTAAILFSILILPLSYYTLFYKEWCAARFLGIDWLKPRDRVKSQLERLRGRILRQLEQLAELVEK